MILKKFIFAALNFNRENMEKKDPIEEARRYVANAEGVIKKAIFSSISTSVKNKVYICRFF